MPFLLFVLALGVVVTALVGNGLGAVLRVNIGPNLTYTGSLATLLWRRVLHGYDTDAPLGEFTRLGVATVLPGLALSVVALWLALQV